MLTHNNLSSIYVLDQDEALKFYTEVLGLELTADMNFGPMRWLTVRVPGDQKEILLERPGAPALDEATAAQVRDLVTKGGTSRDKLRPPAPLPHAGCRGRGTAPLVPAPVAEKRLARVGGQ